MMIICSPICGQTKNQWWKTPFTVGIEYVLHIRINRKIPVLENDSIFCIHTFSCWLWRCSLVGVHAMPIEQWTKRSEKNWMWVFSSSFLPRGRGRDTARHTGNAFLFPHMQTEAKSISYRFYGYAVWGFLCAPVCACVKALSLSHSRTETNIDNTQI